MPRRCPIYSVAAISRHDAVLRGALGPRLLSRLLGRAGRPILPVSTVGAPSEDADQNALPGGLDLKMPLLLIFPRICLVACVR